MISDKSYALNLVTLKYRTQGFNKPSISGICIKFRLSRLRWGEKFASLERCQNHKLKQRRAWQLEGLHYISLKTRAQTYQNYIPHGNYWQKNCAQ